MSEKVKLVYTWIGPRGPLWNTELPNIYGIASAAEHCEVNSNNWWADDTWTTLFSYANDSFEVYPANNIDIEDDRTFVFPMSLAWRIPFEHYFMGNTGILEFAHVPGHLIRLTREKNGYILINHSVEAFMSPWHISALHSYFGNTHGIPLHKIIYITGCINSAEIYEKYCNDNNVPDDKRHRLTIISYPSSQTIFKPNLEDEEPIYNTEFIPEKLFLTWNRRYRHHRMMLALMLESLNLIDRTYISFSKVNVERQTHTFEQSLSLNYMETWLGDSVTPDTISTFASRLPLIIDNETNINQMCEDRGNVSRPYYQNSLVSLITETNFDAAEVTLTEKSYKPIKEKHPFIILGVNGALAGLKKAGFKTFSEFWDESYDEIDCPSTRLRTIRHIVEQIAQWDTDQILNFKRAVKPILEHNYRVLKESSPRTMALEINNIVRNNI